MILECEKNVKTDKNIIKKVVHAINECYNYIDKINRLGRR